MNSKKDKRYIICGIAPGFGGVGKLMEYLNEKIDHTKNVLIYPKTFKFKNRYIRWILNQLSKKIFFNLKLRDIKNKNILIMHHQSLGLKATKKLINENDNIDFYMMDNAFFCIKSYNFLENEKKECLNCLGGNFESAHEYNCKVFPYKYSIKNNIEFLKFLKFKSKKLNFYALSLSHASLIKKHFGVEVSVKVINFLTNEISINQKKNYSLTENSSLYDIVFHAADIDPKGFTYVQELAKELKQYSFFIPTKNNLKMKNVYTSYIEWDSGLKEIVVNSKLVLTPSLWSYTPEAATLKSLLHNGSVGLIKNQYGFANDIDENAFLRLTGNAKIDSKIIDKFLRSKRNFSLSKKGLNYFEKYYQEAFSSLQKYFYFK